MPGAKNWVFTLNNYTEAQEETFKELVNKEDDVNYVIFGRERGDAGTPHLQGYIQLGRRRSLSWIRDHASSLAHWEPSRGTPTQASTYCKKDGDWSEFGERRGGAGSRSDLTEVAAAIRAGGTYRSVAESFPSAAIKYSTGIFRLCFAADTTPRDGPPDIRVFWGPTGTGKSKRVHAEVGASERGVRELFIHPGGQWFDGYDGHEFALFDDFDGG